MKLVTKNGKYFCADGQYLQLAPSPGTNLPKTVLTNNAVFYSNLTGILNYSSFIIAAIPTLTDVITYNGSTQAPPFNYNTDAMELSGTLNAINAGTYETTFTLKDGYIWEDGSLEPKRVSWTITKANSTIYADKTALTVSLYGSAFIRITSSGIDETFTADDFIVTVDDNKIATAAFIFYGGIPGVQIQGSGSGKAGNAIITVQQKENGNYFASNKINITLSVKEGSTVSVAPEPGIEYIDGTDFMSNGMSKEELHEIAALVSNNPDITYKTDSIYFDNYNSGAHIQFNVGDIWTVEMYDASLDQNVIHEFTILGFNHDELADPATAYGSEKTVTERAGFTFEEFATWKERGTTKLYPMYNSRYAPGTWEDSLLRTSTMEAIYNAFPSDLQSIIKPVLKLTNSGNNDTLGELITTTDKCFILSPSEMTASLVRVSMQDKIEVREGEEYRYYVNEGQVNTFTRLDLPGCWTRTPVLVQQAPSMDKNFLLNFYQATSNGISFKLGTASAAISIAFCI